MIFVAITMKNNLLTCVLFAILLKPMKKNLATQIGTCNCDITPENQNHEN
jgi:hypothetical protein